MQVRLASLFQIADSNPIVTARWFISASPAPMPWQGDTAKARAAYKDFLTLWKDADPDIPILQQVKAEYAKLK